MKTEDLLSLISILKDKTVDVKSILTEIQSLSEQFSIMAISIGEIARLAKNIVGKIEKIKQ